MSLKNTLLKSNFPVEIQKLIRRVVRRTRLRRGERKDIAHELITHFEDALEEGIEPNQAIKEYGDVKTAAKLLRKAKKCQRWWVERMMVRSLKWSSAVLGCFLLLYGVFVVFAQFRSPEIKIDYLAQLNDKAASISKLDCAKSLYREASIALFENPEPTVKPTSLYPLMEVPSWPDQNGWPAYKEWLAEHASTIALIKEGAAKRGIGDYASVGYPENSKIPLAIIGYFISDPESLLNVVVPAYGSEFSRLLSFDALAAADAGLSLQCFSDIQAILRLGMQIREIPLSSDFRSFHVIRRALFTLGTVLEHKPNLLAASQLQELREQVLSIRHELVLHSNGDRIILLDTLQRIYTDDGKGDGVIIPAKLAPFFKTYAKKTYDLSEFYGFDDYRMLKAALATPLSDVMHATRREIIDEYDRRIALNDSGRKIKLYALRNEYSSFNKLRGGKSPSISNKFYVLDLLMESWFSPSSIAYEKYIQAHCDGMVAVLFAIEQHRMTGKWPTDLSQAEVLDSWSDDPILIAMDEGLPVIYSVGADQDDDRGEVNLESLRNGVYNQCDEGDWVFWSLAQPGPRIAPTLKQEVKW